MIVVHHLDQSRSFRILWLLEELGLSYDLVGHRRDAKTRLSPASLKAVHPLGKAPLVEDDGFQIFESAAIVDYLIRRHGGGRFAPDPATREYDQYQMWLAYAEGSAMLPVMLNLYAKTLGAETPALRTRLDDELGRHRGHIAAALADGGYLVGSEPTGADITMAMVAESLDRIAPGERSSAIRDWLDRLKRRPAYLAAVERGGDPEYRPARREKEEA